jgi:hypothetical protein
MKTILTLIMAVVAYSSFAQEEPRTDSLVRMTDSLTRADSLMRADSLTHFADSLIRVDSILHTRIRVLDFPIAIDVILRDFPENLRHITGELVLAQGEFENYASLVQLPGAEDCIVTRYHSRRDSTVSWQATMYNDDDFGKAARQYRELFQKLKSCYISQADGTVLYLQGTWEPAKEGASFTTSTFRPGTTDWRYREVKVELELVYLLADWAVRINIVSKKRDDEVGDNPLAP